MWAIDAPTLLLVLLGAIYLGLLGFFNFDAISWALGEGYRQLTFQVVGVAAVWQLLRQRWA